MTPGNYTTHALEHFLEHHDMYATAFQKSAKLIDVVLEFARSGEKFLMPDYGRVFEHGTRKGDFRDLLHLPYPVCVLEFHCPARVARDHDVKESDYYPKRRIAICVDTRQMPGFEDTKAESSVIVMAMFETDENEWMIAPAAGVLNPTLTEIDPVTGIFTISPHPVILEIYDNPRYTWAEKVHDISEEVTAAVEFMMTINCENVKRERIEAPAKLNKKRQASGKAPFSSYWMLDVFKEPRAPGGPSQGGSHASPRMHFRRGHIRRLASGKSTFVRHTMVGNAAAGVIQKTYNLKGKAA